MIPSRRGEVLALLDEALQTPPDARPSLLDAVCVGDSELRREVESLLDLETAADGFLAAPEPPGLPPGTRIGPYRIVELLGRGGMGAVYEAVREDDFTQRVALKLVPRELASPFVVRRFHLERQILARLDHPNIARLLDGGTTEDGRPYLVMEHVEGVAIDEFCEARNLAPRQRLELLLPVCSALAFAHQNLVAHRDIKPGNILVTADGVPKLLDFGIAKLLDPAEGPADLTRTLERPMTPRYASPEQVRGDLVTPASDLYSLGVLLYRLLTGRLPSGLDTCGLEEVARRICEQEPARPSTEAGAGDPRQLRRLAGDVDAIVLKALRKEPRHRYGSAEQLAEDVRRYLAGHPVLARRGTLLYRGGKFARRHRFGLAAAMAVLLATGAFLVREQERRAAEQQRTERTIGVLQGLLDLADPDRRSDAAVIQVLETTRRQLAALKADPDLRAELLATLGRVHHKLGHGEEARRALAESLAIWRQRHAEDHAGLAVRLNNLGALDLDQGDYESAEARFSEARTLYEKDATATPEERAVNLDNLATVRLYRGRSAEAEALYRAGLELRLGAFGRDDPRVSYSLRSLGALDYNRGDFAAAEPLLREALRIRLASHGPENTALAPILDLLGNVRLARGDPAEAETLYLRALGLRRRRLGTEHAELARSERNLAVLRLGQGRVTEARALLEKATARLKRAMLPGDWRLADAESVLGAVLAAEGRRREAGPLLRESYRTLAATRGEYATATREARQRLSVLEVPPVTIPSPPPRR
ncbi:MAG TPA: serine/threonine-protein kinase [Thermoanaerobaculia bacterium]|jgi:serine/threonine-protein kinase|nr:serine/threonine-protein kinase [Thermoanaerobaculia bacterium]